MTICSEEDESERNLTPEQARQADRAQRLDAVRLHLMSLDVSVVERLYAEWRRNIADDERRSEDDNLDMLEALVYSGGSGREE